MIDIIAAPPEDMEVMARLTGLAVTGEFKMIEALDTDTGKVLGMVGYDKWTRNSVRIHVVVPPGSVPPRKLALEALRYGFDTKGVLIAEIASSNARSIRLAKFSGFRRVCKIKDGWAVGDDLIIFQLRREWLEVKGRQA